MSEPTIAQYLAKFASSLSFEIIPKATLKQIKNHLLDSLGVGLAGSTQETARICYKTLSAMEGLPESTVIGEKKKLPSSSAAFINGTSIHSIELDDGRAGAAVHPGASILATSLAVSEAGAKGGKEFLLSALIGYEVTLRLAMAMFPHHRRMGFHPTATCGTFGAALAAGKILGLSAPEMVNALGIAGTFASGLREGKGDALMMKRIHGGKAAQSGILAALLSKNGFKAPETIFEGNNGFFRLFSKEYDPKKITEGLGESFVTDQCYYKPYSCCRHFHAPIDSLLELIKKNNPKPENIEHIHLKIYREGTYYDEKEPKNMLDAQFSLPYTLAVVLYDHKALLEQFGEDKINHQGIKELASKVTIEFDPNLDEEFVKNKKMAHLLEIKCKDGNILNNRVDYPKGSERNPFTDEEIFEKFQNLASMALNKERISTIVSLWKDIEETKNILTFSALLQK